MIPFSLVSFIFVLFFAIIIITIVSSHLYLFSNNNINPFQPKFLGDFELLIRVT